MSDNDTIWEAAQQLHATVIDGRDLPSDETLESIHMQLDAAVLRAQAEPRGWPPRRPPLFARNGRHSGPAN